MKKTFISLIIGLVVIVAFALSVSAATVMVNEQKYNISSGSYKQWVKTNYGSSIITDFGPTSITGSGNSTTGYDIYTIAGPVGGKETLHIRKDYAISTIMCGYMNMGNTPAGNVRIINRAYNQAGSTNFKGWSGVQRFLYQ